MASGTDSDGREYSATNAAAIRSWSREHKNTDETHVAVIHASADYHFALAVDVDEDGEPLASHLIDVTHTTTEAEERALRWMVENPKGIKAGNGLGRILG